MQGDWLEALLGVVASAIAGLTAVMWRRNDPDRLEPVATPVIYQNHPVTPRNKLGRWVGPIAAGGITALGLLLFAIRIGGGVRIIYDSSPPGSVQNPVADVAPPAALGPQWECMFDSSGVGSAVVLCDGAYAGGLGINDSVSGEPENSVVDSAFGFPGRMLRTALWEGVAAVVRTDSNTDTISIPMPQIGEAVFWQIYFRVERPTVGDNLGVLHWWHHGGTNLINGFYTYDTNYQNGDSMDFRMTKNWPAWETTVWLNCWSCLQFAHTYRMQIRYIRSEALRLDIGMQVWDSTGTVVRTQADWGIPFANADSNQVIVRDTSDIRQLISWVQLGTNDSVSPGGMSVVKWLWNCCEAKKTDADTSAWLGPAPYN